MNGPALYVSFTLAVTDPDGDIPEKEEYFLSVSRVDGSLAAAERVAETLVWEKASTVG